MKERRKGVKLQLDHFFRERTYENYDEINGCCFDKFEEAVEIVVKKQKGKEKN